MAQTSMPALKNTANPDSPPWVRKEPPLPAQILVGAVLYGAICPAMWILEGLGLSLKLLDKMNARTKRDTEANNPFRGYTPGAQDVFVMTLPKSGTNWMMQVAHQLIWHGNGEYDHIHDLVPWPDTKAMRGFMREYAIPLDLATHWQQSPERKRVIKTHFNWELLPYSDQAHYIAVIRDPKDVFVSSYFFLRDGILGPAMPSLDTWFKMFITGKGMMGMSWPENTAGYWAQRSRPNVLVLSFKKMKRDLEGTVRQVAAFLDVHAGEDVIRTVCEKSSFAYMKNIDRKFNMGRLVAWREPGSMIRKGTQGGSSELLSPERQREVDTYCQSELKRLGCDLPYEEFADLA